ncbi:unnamed protein product [Nippostrongylus brasiliensis]|uniref:Uncharacterized protein n=1 Tax=Nippostrongylus brasiliensis TaxID=27835 RepID=A0A0N4XVB5_NIPBR|nr:unnamed protein product [Nippostrongylus brasiliensis]
MALGLEMGAPERLNVRVEQGTAKDACRWVGRTTTITARTTHTTQTTQTPDIVRHSKPIVAVSIPVTDHQPINPSSRHNWNRRRPRHRYGSTAAANYRNRTHWISFKCEIAAAATAVGRWCQNAPGNLSSENEAFVNDDDELGSRMRLSS